MTVYDDLLLKYSKILLGVVVLSTFILAILGSLVLVCGSEINTLP